MDDTAAPFDEYQIESILAADIGSCWTRVTLLDRIEGRYRFITRSELPTSNEPPTANVSAAVKFALRQIEASTGRVLLDANEILIAPERADGSGVDLFVVTCSAARPLDVAVAGLVEQLSVASARRVAQATYSRIVDSFALDSPAGPWGSPDGTIGVVRQLYAHRPQVVIMAGGSDGGAVEPLVELAEAVGVAAEALPATERPVVVFAGNAAAAQQVGGALAEIVEYRTTDNVRPSAWLDRSAAARSALEDLFRDRRLARVPGLGAVKSWSHTPILPTLEAMAHVVRFLARQSGRRILGVDVGSANTALVSAVGAGKGQVFVRTDLGTGSGLSGVLAQSTPLELSGWLPASREIELSGDGVEDEVIDALATQQLRPSVRPQTAKALAFLQVAAREVLRLALAETEPGLWAEGLTVPHARSLPRFDTILLGGGVFREAPNPAQAVMIALDGLQPTGVSHLLRDRVGLVPAIGALAGPAPEVAAALLSGPALESLGTVIVPVGSARAGAEVLHFRMTLPDGSGYDVSVEAGRIYREWLPAGQTTRLVLRPARGIDVGFGPGKGGEITVNGGLAGLVIDARGRPLPLEADLAARRARAQQWWAEMGA